MSLFAKRCVFILGVTLLLLVCGKAQCVPTCSNYAMVSIPFTTFFPGTGTATPSFTPNIDDGATPAIPLGFPFNFYCNTYTAISICSNGYIKFDDGIPINFGSPAVSHPPQNFPSTVTPNGIVALNMADLDPNMGGSITYGAIGASPSMIFVITYSNVPMWNYTTSTNSGQIVLYESSNIIELYSEAINVSNTSFYPGSQGLESNSGLLGINVPGRTQTTWSASASAVRFLPYTPLPPASVTGNSLLCQGVGDNYYASFILDATAYNWSMPSGWQGTSTISALTASAGTSGNLSVTATYTCGTSLPAIFNVSVMPAPTVAIGQVTPVIMCSGNTATFQPTGALSYTLSPGAMLGVPPFTDTPLSTTIYSVIGMNSFGCLSLNKSTTTVNVKQTPLVSVNSGSICLGNAFLITPLGGASTYSITGNTWNVSPTQAGAYTYTVAGSSQGCVSDPVVSTLTVFPVPQLTATASRPETCSREPTILTAEGADSYQWSNQAKTHSLVVTPLITTFYVVTGTDLNGCKNTATVSITVNPCTGLYEERERPGVILYPNPSKGKLDVHVDSALETKLTIYNGLGQMILETQLYEQKTELDLQALPAGLYYVEISTVLGTQVAKLIRE